MNKPLILAVEDDTAVRNLITTTLETQDYRFHTAANGAQAILEAASQKPDIMLLDLGLPDMDGVEVIKKIRSWSNLPIIVISARSEDRDKIEALDAGADDYLTKPFSVEELLARLRVILRRLQYMESSSSQEGKGTCIRIRSKGANLFSAHLIIVRSSGLQILYYHFAALITCLCRTF